MQRGLACEQAALVANLPDKDPRKHTGRGLMPQYEWRSLADRSNLKYTERLVWEVAAKDAIVGPNLYSTLWYTIAGILESTASARRLDNASHQPSPEQAEATPQAPGAIQMLQVGGSNDVRVMCVCILICWDAYMRSEVPGRITPPWQWKDLAHHLSRGITPTSSPLPTIRLFGAKGAFASADCVGFHVFSLAVACFPS